MPASPCHVSANRSRVGINPYPITATLRRGLARRSSRKLGKFLSRSRHVLPLGNMIADSPTVSVSPDADLVARSLAGDRDAYGLLIQRHQSVVCALTYAACGD